MGFFSGFVRLPKCYKTNLTTTQFSGFALTTTLLYVSLQVHKSNRLAQRTAIHEQVTLLNSISSPRGAYDRRLAPRDLRTNETQDVSKPTPTLEDSLRHRWNVEVKALTRKAYESRWEDARDAAVEGWKAAKRFVKRDN